MEITAGAKAQMVGSRCFLTYTYNNKLSIFFSVAKNVEKEGTAS
jgi:hypothetical protein